MKGITTYRITTRERLKSIAESKKANEVLIKHYTFILEHFDDIIAVHDKEIAEIADVKAEILKQFIEAPQQLKELNQHLSTLKNSRQNITDRDSKVKRVKHMRERLANLEQECRAAGVNINETLKNITKYEKEKIVEREAAKKADDTEAVAREAVELI